MQSPEIRRERVLRALALHEAPLYAYATRLVRDPERARDVVQETFLRLCAQPDATPDGPLAPWLYRVCRNLALDVRKKERPMATTDALAERASADPGPLCSAERKDGASRVLRALAALPENQREVLRLKLQHGLAYREIAQITDLSETNVGFMIHRGLKSLRERLSSSEARPAGTSGGAR